jgi:hypothetical protein
MLTKCAGTPIKDEKKINFYILQILIIQILIYIENNIFYTLQILIIQISMYFTILSIQLRI